MNEIVKKAENSVTLDGMLTQADLFVKSGFFPRHVDTKEKALVIMLKGRELGLPFTESLSKISVIQGVATTKVETLLGLARKTGQMEDFKQRFVPNEIAPQYCEVTIKRKGQSPHTCRFGDEEAQTMGLTSRDNYKKQKATMYSWRAISKNLRVTFPDAIGGLYLEEEIADGVLIKPEEDTTKAKVTEVEYHPEQTAKTEEIKETIIVEGAAGLDNPMEVDKLGAYIPRPPFDKNFPDRCIMEIYGTTTPAGKPKGSIFLEMISKHSKDAEERAIVSKFLEVIKRT